MQEFIAVYKNGTTITKDGPDANKFIFSLPGDYFVFLKENNDKSDYGINLHYLNKDSKKDKLFFGEYEFINLKYTTNGNWIITIFERASEKAFELTVTDYPIQKVLGKIVKTLTELSSFGSFDEYILRLQSEKEFEKLKKENDILKEEVVKLKAQLENLKQN